MKLHSAALAPLFAACVFLASALADPPQTATDAAGPQSTAKHAATDALGDPLPDHALLRLGTLRFHSPSGIYDMSLSPDEKTVVTIGEELIAWDAKTGKELWRASSRDNGIELQAASYGVRAIVFSNDSRQFYTLAKLNEVIIWDTSSGQKKTLGINGREAAVRPAQDFRWARAVDISRDGKTLVTGEYLGVSVCDDKGQVRFEVPNPVKVPIDLGNINHDRLLFGGDYSFGRLSPDGKTLAVVVSSAPNEIRLLDLVTGDELRKVPLKARLVRLAFSPDGKQIVTTERDNAVRLYDVDNGKELWSRIVQLTNPNENYTSAVAFSPDGKLIAAGATDNRIHLLDPASGDEGAILGAAGWYPWALAFTADSKTLFSAGWDGAVHRWDVVARKELPLPVGIRGSEVTAASSDGQTLAYKDGTGSIRLVRAKDAVEQEVLKRPGTTYSQLCFAPDGKLLAGGGSSGKNVHVTIWDLDTKKVVHRWEWAKGRDPNSEVEALAFAPKGDRVAAAVFRQSKAYIWDLGSDKQIAKLKHKEIYGLAFSPDGTRLATVGWDEFVRFWDAHTGEARIQAQVQDPTKKNGGDPRMYAVSYSPHDGLLATAQLDGKVRIWNADDMTPRVEFQVPHRFVYGAMCFSPDGLWVATGAQDGTVTLWDSMTGEKVWELGRHRGDVYTVGFGRDNRTLLTGGDDGIGYLWDLRPNEERGDSDLDKLWDAVAGQDAPAAYQAMWKLRDTPERTVPLIAEKLRPVKDVIEPEREEKQLSVDEEYRLKQLKHLLDDKVETVQRSVTVRRAVSLLAEIGTPQAIKVLTDLAQQNPDSYVGRVAATTLERTKASEPRK